MTNETSHDGGERVEEALRDVERAETQIGRAEAKIAEGEADLITGEEKLREAERELKEGRGEVTVTIDGTERRIRGGRWQVAELKVKLGVDPAKVLAEITPQGLKDLDDGGETNVYEGEKFMSHARSGGSS
ncbi:MAG: hypothetical protein WBQ17_10280 [Rhizomicrobium sp.]